MVSHQLPEPPTSKPRARAGLSALDRARLSLATFAGRVASLASRVVGRGSGQSIQGAILTRLAPRAFEHLLAGRTVVAVTGTNGKTTTTHFVAAAVREALGKDADRLVTNADGANLHRGIASALSEAPKADIAVLEVDERVVADLVKLGKPKILAMLNFSRDQLDRNHEIKALARAWRNALEEAGEDGPLVIANAEEPLVAWAAETARETIWVNSGSVWNDDAVLCPGCDTVLERENPEVDDDGNVTFAGTWRCPGCGRSQHKATIVVRGETVHDADGNELDLQLNVPGRFNVGNAAVALATVREFGVDTETALAGMRKVQAPAGRFGINEIRGVKCRLMLSKNPAGWAESLPLGTSDPLVLAIDSVLADGRDVSWLWDVDFESLRGRQVIATGRNTFDLAVRLDYAGVECQTIKDLGTAIETAGSMRADQSAPLDVIATYTPFQVLRRMGGAK